MSFTPARNRLHLSSTFPPMRPASSRLGCGVRTFITDWRTRLASITKLEMYFDGRNPCGRALVKDWKGGHRDSHWVTHIAVNGSLMFIGWGAPPSLVRVAIFVDRRSNS